MSNAINTNLSYFRIRKIIGILGITLWALVWIISREALPSISAYYYSISGVVFVGILILTGTFLLSYRGYEREEEKISDNFITNLGGIALIIVAIVPVTFEDLGGCGSCPTPICHCDGFWHNIHFISAVVFFATMGFISAIRFTRSNKQFSTYSAKYRSQKKWRNTVYRICGFGMWAILIFAFIVMQVTDIDKDTRFVYWIEVALLILFGASWLIKGKALADLNIHTEDRK